MDVAGVHHSHWQLQGWSLAGKPAPTVVVVITVKVDQVRENIGAYHYDIVAGNISGNYK